LNLVKNADELIDQHNDRTMSKFNIIFNLNFIKNFMMI
jgi:hypothetical protein